MIRKETKHLWPKSDENAAAPLSSNNLAQPFIWFCHPVTDYFVELAP